MYVPTTYTNNATALFLNFHGYLTTMEFQYDLTGMETVRSRSHSAQAAGSCSLGRAEGGCLWWTRVLLLQVAEEGNFVAVVPQGWRLSWSAGACCGSAARQEIDDVGYAS